MADPFVTRPRLPQTGRLMDVARRRVAWPADRRRSPDYAWLADRPSGQRFALTINDILALAAANAFPIEPDRRPLLFALRGATVLTDDADAAPFGCILDRERLPLADGPPSHHAPGCVIGLFDAASGRLSAFPGATVPNATAVIDAVMRQKTGRKRHGNLLATGFYRFRIGTHEGAEGEIRRALLQVEPGTPASADQRARVAVMRSFDDLGHTTTRAVWDDCVPHDNLHPAQATAGRADAFSSWGCLTIAGRYDADADRHEGAWGMFQDQLALADRAEVDLMLITGQEAALASCHRADNGGAPLPGRLHGRRHGSRGDDVAAVQEALGLPVDGVFGAATTCSLVHVQRRAKGYADGLLHGGWHATLEGLRRQR